MTAAIRRLAALAAFAMSVQTAPACGQTSVTLFAGYGGSNGVDNAATNESADTDKAASYGVALGVALDPARELQFLFNQQSTTLSPGAGAAPFDLTIRYLHVGGSLYLDGRIGQGWYAVGGVGATQFSPGTDGYGSEFKPSFNLGFGYVLPLGERMAVMAEARGYLTLVNSSGGFLCSGGCVAVLRADGFTQYEGRIGLMARF